MDTLSDVPDTSYELYPAGMSRVIRSASPGGGLGACMQQDLRFPRADDDATAGLATDVFSGLTQGKGLLRLSGLLIADREGDAPVIAVCHGMTLTRGSLE